MARFYIGQPVISILTREEWLRGLTYYDDDMPTPEKGSRYTIQAYISSSTFLKISEIHVVGIAYSEEGFVPITETQVKSILAEVIKSPLITKKREPEPV